MTKLGGWAHRSSAAFAVLATASLAHAATYFVRAGGNDHNDGRTPQAALASIRSATRLLHRPGDSIVVGPGTYQEGNIQPRKNGRPDAPIAFFADTTGSLTGDRPGAVIIAPPNAKDSTTGFIVYGQHDVRIEGFEIDGAKDAGIQVRPHPRSGVDSAAITLLNNTAQRGRIGIQVTAVGDVIVSGNRLIGNSAGLTLKSGQTGTLRPFISGNVVEQNGNAGISINRSLGGSITQNVLGPSTFSLSLGNADDLVVTANHVVSGHARMWGNSMEVTDNVFEAGAGMSATNGHLVFARNQIVGDGFSLLIRGGTSEVEVLDSNIPRLYVSGASPLDLERNAIGTAQFGVGAVTAIANRFAGSVKMSGGDRLEMNNNTAGNCVARALEVLMQDNRFTGGVTIGGNKATITGNAAGSLSLVHTGQQEGGSGPFVVTGNVIAADARIQQDVSALVVEDNVTGGMLRTIGRGELKVHRNEAHGISCLMLSPQSVLELAENNSHDSRGGGLLVVGAGSAIVQNNAASNSADSGLAVRRTKHLVVSGNEFLSNPEGGISVRTSLAGDCNRDLHVTIDEIVTAISIDLDQRPLADCGAADLDGDGRVGVQEIVLAVADALSPPGLHDSSTAIDSNRVEHNGRFGIDAFGVGTVWAADNRVIENAGIALAIYSGGMADAGEVADNVLGLGGAQGLLVDGVARASVRNNVIFSNREAGILLRDAPGTAVVNNLVYANGDNGIAVGLGGALPTVGTSLANNTVYGNAGWGIAIGSAAAPSTGTTIHDNIVQGNGRGGIAASTAPLLGPMLGFNLDDDGNGNGVPTTDSDFSADPQFVAPAGADGILGGTGFADDDFHVQPTSPAVDAGSAPAAALGITGSVVAGQSADTGVVDLGYHYGAQP